MLRNLNDIREDKAFDLLTEAILQRDQPRTADLFHKMIVRDGRSIGEALSVVAAAEAPFVNVPCHINFKDGNIVLTNNDHTLLGLRASTCLMPYLPEKYRLLPLLQSVWYIGAGLDIWNQLLAKYPGRYATMKGIHVPPPDYGPVVWLEEAEPIREEGTLDERLHSYMIATMTGNSKRAHGLFLGIAEDEANAPGVARDDRVSRPDRPAGHGDRPQGAQYRAQGDPRPGGHRPRQLHRLGEVRTASFYMGVPDMAVGPLYYSLYDHACVHINAEFPEDAGKNLKKTNQTPLSPREVEEMLDVLMTADQDTVFNLITAHLKAGKSIKSLGDVIQLGAAELILRNTTPRLVHERPAPVRLLQRREQLAAHDRQSRTRRASCT